MKKMLTKIRNLILHTLVLALVFVGALLFFERTLNQVTPDTADTMADTTFPLVYMVRGGVSFNCLHGYSRDMDVSYLRDSVTPLTSDREIGIRIQTFSSAVESISYEVQDLSGGAVLENTQVSGIEQDGDELTATLSLRGQMLMNQEYALKLSLVSGGRTIYYYTQVVLADGLHTDEYLNFVSGFYDKTVNRTDLDTVGAAVEPDETTDEEQTLAFMDIHDSVNQLTWGNLLPQIYYKPTPKITQINTKTAALTLEYRIAAVNDAGQTEIFNVHEYYRVRYTDSRVFLLNFERNTDEVFNPENDVLEALGIRLGITGKDVNYKTDERSKIIAFVQENALWSYERSTSKMTQIFSFPQDTNMDARDFYDANDIHILEVNTQGDVLFAVSGYMNRGDHEGDNGILLYSYTAGTDMVNELVFVQTMETGERLERDLNSLLYVTADHNYLNFLLEGIVYRMSLADRSYTIIAENVGENCHAVSDSGQYFSYLPQGDPYASTNIKTINLETLETAELSCGEGEKIRPICYLNDDLVYGTARDTDIADGNIEVGYFPMFRITIAGALGDAKKVYEPEGICVTQVNRSEHMLSLTRVYRGVDGSFQPASEDQIMDTSTTDSVSTGVGTKTDSKKQTMVYLRVGASITDTTPDIVRSKVINYASPRTVSLPAGGMDQTVFYVYSSGKLKDVYVRANEAIRAADNGLGMVLDGEGQYIWVRGDRETTADIRVEKVPEALHTGAASAEALDEVTDDLVLDLKGCTLDEILYFISHGTPVMARTAEGPVIIVGYDEYNTHLLKPGESEWYYYGINDSTELFKNAGNQFYLCLSGN